MAAIEGVTYDRAKRRHLYVIALDADECENIAAALGPRDAARAELYAAADEIRRRDEEPA